MAKPANLGKTIIHGCVALVGVLFLAFLALPYVSAGLKGYTGETQNAYDVLTSPMKDVTGTDIFAWISVLLLVIVACLLVITAVLALLGDFGVISNEKFTKVVKWTLVALVILAVVAAVLNLIACCMEVSDLKDAMSIGSTWKALKEAGYYVNAGWAQLILNLVLSLGVAGAVAYTVVGCKGSKAE